MSRSRRRARSQRGFLAVAAVLAVALLGTSASFALASGPIYTLLSKAGKPAQAGTQAKARQGAISKASRVALRLRHRSSDKTAPDTSITSGPAATTTSTSASFAFLASEAGSTLSCKLDGGRWRSCSSPKAYSGLALGSHTFSVRARDAAGNIDASPATRSWFIAVAAPPPPPPPATVPPADTSAPETTILSGPEASGTAASASFAFSSSESGSSFGCKLDSGSWGACATPKAYSALAPGSHAFSVRASDAAGNVDATPATRTWTVEAVAPPPPPPADTTPPETSITAGPAASTTATSASFSLSASEPGSSLACKLDGASWGSCGSPKTYSGLSIGAHGFSARATDAAGNVDATPASQSWTVEAVAPPPPPSGDCTTTVSTVSSAQSGVSSAAPGAVVCLTDGSYGKVTLNATKAAPGVTLRSARAGGATVAGISIQGSNLTVARFVSTSSIQIQPGATGITVEHNKVTGGGQGIDACPSSTTTCNDMAIIGNKLIGPFGEDAIHLNRYHDGDGDGVGVLIEGNEITNVRENGNHSDCLQTVWVGDHIVFRKNYLHDNRCQGFFVKDQASLG
ncbi:MAG: hypothetical protein WA862_06905, partial [Solirubrobacterales bacterium]